MFDLKGRKIKSIRYKFHDQGQKEINLNISDISSGIYLLQLNSNNNSITKKIIKPF